MSMEELAWDSVKCDCGHYCICVEKQYAKSAYNDAFKAGLEAAVNWLWEYWHIPGAPSIFEMQEGIRAIEVPE